MIPPSSVPRLAVFPLHPSGEASGTPICSCFLLGGSHLRSMIISLPCREYTPWWSLRSCAEEDAAHARVIGGAHDACEQQRKLLLAILGIAAYYVPSLRPDDSVSGASGSFPMNHWAAGTGRASCS